MKYLLDTNICIFALKNRPPAVLERLRSLRASDVGVSAVTAAELFFGAAKSQHAARNLEVIERFLAPLELASFDRDAARTYGEVRRGLEAAGPPIGPNDTLIAAHALTLGVVLVTNNVRHFARVRGLTIEDWTQAP